MVKIKRVGLCVCIVAAAFGRVAKASTPTSPLAYSPLGRPDAAVGGVFQRHLSFEPDSFSPIAGSDSSARQVFEYVMEGLLQLNPDTYQFEPSLAQSFTVSKDQLTFTFHLRKDAHFSDGHPVTAEDVQFSVESVKDPKQHAGVRIPYYDDVDRIEVLDPHTIQFRMKRKYFKNLEVLASSGYTPIVPKHIYADPERKWKGPALVGSGPYKVQSYTRGKKIELVRDSKWWGLKTPELAAQAKFSSIVFRFVREEALAFDMLKRGQIDFLWPVRPEVFEVRAVGAPFGQKIAKVEAENQRPKRWGFVGWNQKNPIFQERSVRLALAHLFNRQQLIDKYMFGKSVPAVGPFYFTSGFMAPNAKPILFDSKKAAELLKQAGWSDTDADGVLDKKADGKKIDLRFALLLPSRDAEKYFTQYQQDLKAAGIAMSLQTLDWSLFSARLDEHKFDAVAMSWEGGSPEEDLKQIWHTDSARSGGSNFISYSNKEVDRLIDQARAEMDAGARKKLWQKASALIVEDAPYLFLFNPKYDQYLLSKKIGYDKPTYNFDVSYRYWFMSGL